MMWNIERWMIITMFHVVALLVLHLVDAKIEAQAGNTTGLYGHVIILTEVFAKDEAEKDLMVKMVKDVFDEFRKDDAKNKWVRTTVAEVTEKNTIQTKHLLLPPGQRADGTLDPLPNIENKGRSVLDVLRFQYLEDLRQKLPSIEFSSPRPSALGSTMESTKLPTILLVVMSDQRLVLSNLISAIIVPQFEKLKQSVTPILYSPGNPKQSSEESRHNTWLSLNVADYDLNKDNNTGDVIKLISGLLTVSHRNCEETYFRFCNDIPLVSSTKTEPVCQPKITSSVKRKGNFPIGRDCGFIGTTEDPTRMCDQSCSCQDACCVGWTAWTCSMPGVLSRHRTFVMADSAVCNAKKASLASSSGLKEEKRSDFCARLPVINEEVKSIKSIDVHLQGGSEPEARTLKQLHFRNHNINTGFRLQSIDGSKKMVRLIPKRQLVMPLIFGSSLDRASEYIIENITIRLEPDPVLWEMLEKFKYQKWPVEFKIVYSCSKCTKNPYAVVVVLVKVENQRKSNMVFQSKKGRVFFSPDQLIPFDRERYLLFKVPMDPKMEHAIEGKTVWFVMNQWLTVGKSDKETMEQLIKGLYD